jgi:hypothetical protein
MRDLEAETYRRLIAWEDEKKYSISGNAPTRRDTMEAQKSFKSIYWRFLEDTMEEWLSDKAAAIKTLKDDCREVEEINRELDRRMFSWELLSIELRRLYDG